MGLWQKLCQIFLRLGAQPGCYHQTLLPLLLSWVRSAWKPDWWLSQPFLAPSLVSHTGSSLNKTLKCLIPSWQQLLREPQCPYPLVALTIHTSLWEERGRKEGHLLLTRLKEPGLRFWQWRLQSINQIPKEVPKRRYFRGNSSQEASSGICYFRFHWDKGEAAFYRESSHPGSQLLQIYANVVFKFLHFWLVWIM